MADLLVVSQLCLVTSSTNRPLSEQFLWISLYLKAPEGLFIVCFIWPAKESISYDKFNVEFIGF